MSYKILVLPFIMLLTACAPPRPAVEVQAPEKMPLEKRERQTKAVSSWDMSGAIAAKSQNKAWTATVNWYQKGADHYQIRLIGPLGGGAILIEKRGSTITLKDGPKTRSSHNADALFYQQTGLRLPVNNLYYWVRGIPAPGSVQSKHYDAYNRLTQLKQQGYSLDYLGYTDVGGTSLPNQIKLQGNGLYIKLVIQSWKV